MFPARHRVHTTDLLKLYPPQAAKLYLAITLPTVKEVCLLLTLRYYPNIILTNCQYVSIFLEQLIYLGLDYFILFKAF